MTDWRNRAIEQLTSRTLDLLVIGGGIVGAGVARDAAMRGLAVGLVDRRDFAFGTSSRSSRLLHGGLRYLAQGRLRLVREASLEKLILHRIAPHLTQPLAFVFPTYRSSEWKHWKLSIGVKLYDLLCGGGNFGASESLDPTQTFAALPVLRADQLTGAVRYFDGFTNDARLVLDTLRSASSAGAVLLNYATAGGERFASEWTCDVEDGVSIRMLQVRAHCIVNATGAWSPRLLPSRVKLRLTKGVHVVIDHERLPILDAVVMTDGPRILFAIPWGKRVILGTTDTDYDGDLDSPRAEPQDVGYILGITNRTFPKLSLTSADIISAWAGIRPLIADPHGRPSDISRRHLINSPEPGWFDVAGGKLTTYRLMAEQTVDQVARYLKRDTPRSKTANRPLLSANESRFSSILPPEASREAVEHFCRNEWAIHLDDVMIRRTGWRYYHRDHLQIARQVAEWMKEMLDWSDEAMQTEFDGYTAATG
jgi:glycerol-3-phosphate dehydrogenase